MIREPMNGEECVIPLRDRGFRSFLCSPSSLRENLFRVLHMDTGKMPRHIRHITSPASRSRYRSSWMRWPSTVARIS